MTRESLLDRIERAIREQRGTFVWVSKADADELNRIVWGQGPHLHSNNTHGFDREGLIDALPQMKHIIEANMMKKLSDLP